MNEYYIPRWILWRVCIWCMKWNYCGNVLIKIILRCKYGWTAAGLLKLPSEIRSWCQLELSQWESVLLAVSGSPNLPAAVKGNFVSNINISLGWGKKKKNKRLVVWERKTGECGRWKRAVVFLRLCRLTVLLCCYSEVVMTRWFWLRHIQQ